MKKIMLGLCLFLSINNLYAKGDLYLFEIENKEGKYSPELIVKAFEKNGFYISATSEMNKPFLIEFKETKFDIFTLLTLFHREFSEKLIKKHAKAGIFVPMGIGIYQQKHDDFLHISILRAQTQEKILGFKDVNLHKIEMSVIKTLKETLPGVKMSISAQALKAEGPLVTLLEYNVEPNNWKNTKEDLQLLIEDGFKPSGFVMSNFTDFNYRLTKADTVESGFDFYETYSICKLKVIYTVSKTSPEAAAFAPCSFMFYKKKDENKIVMGFPTVYNWMSSAYLNNAESKKVLIKAQREFETILKEASE